MLTQQQQAAIEHLNEWRVGALFMEPGTGKTRFCKKKEKRLLFQAISFNWSE